MCLRSFQDDVLTKKQQALSIQGWKQGIFKNPVKVKFRDPHGRCRGKNCDILKI